MSSPSDDRLREVFNRLERYIEDRYRLPVVISDVVDPFTGDLDGAEIRVDFDIIIADAVFIIAHLFGHTVQWNTSERSRALAMIDVKAPSDEMLQELAAYEREACRFSLQLFHDVGIFDLDQWLSDFSACDFAYLTHFYRTGSRTNFWSLWKDGTSLLEPKPIPEFTPTRWMARWQGTVV